MTRQSSTPSRPTRERARPSVVARQRLEIVRRYAVTVVVALVGLGLSLAAALSVRQHSRTQAQAALFVVAQNTAAAIQNSLDVHLEVVYSVAALFRASTEVEREDFRAFTAHAITRHRGIQALEWAPRIAGEDREGVEQSLHEEGFEGFRFTERDRAGRLKIAEPQDEYFPVLYVEPLSGNESAFGYADRGSERSEAIQEARDRGRPIASRRLRLIQEVEDQFGFIVFVPVYDGSDPVPATSAARTSHLRGLVEGIFRVYELVREGVRQLDLRLVNFSIFDDGDREDSRPLFVHRLEQGQRSPALISRDEGQALRRELTSDAHQVATLRVAGRTWTLLMRAEEGFQAAGSWLPWLVLAAGLLFTSLLAVYLGTYQNRASKIEALVEKRTAEVTAATEQLQLARYVIDRAVVAVLRLDAAGRIIGANEAACVLYGHGRREMLALSAGRLDRRMQSERWDRHWARLRRGKALTFESTHQTKTGGSLPVEVTANYLKFGERAFICWFVRDITDRKTAESALRRSEEQLRQGQKMEAIGLLAGGVAHDFNNLLSGILGFAELGLMKLERDHPIRRHLLEITKAGNRAASLTRQLLAFSRRQVLQPELLSLNDVVAELGQMLGRLIGEDIALELTLGSDLPPVFADPGQIEQVLLNLCINARDAMPGGGRLFIETAGVDVDEDQAREKPEEGLVPGAAPRLAPGGYIRLTVRDTGTGMSEEVRAHLFEPFFTTKSVGRGTGLGLATVYGIVTQSGGVISVESVPGEGTRFDIFLPCASSPARVLEMYPDEGELVALPVTKHRSAILLVEDEETVRGLCFDVLHGHGYEVIQASSGEEALELLSQRRDGIDLLLTDVVMTGMSGIDLAEALVARHPTLPVVVMTGYTDRKVDLQAIPGMRLIFKPFSPIELLTEVKESLRSRRRSSAELATDRPEQAGS